MRIVVTGAAGFIGRNLVEFLDRTGRDVVAIDRRPQPELADVTYLRTDLVQPSDEVDAALRDADAVLHLAGCPGVRDRRPDVAVRRYRDNVLAAERVLTLTPLATPVVLTSSSSVYGGSDGQPCREDQPVRPRGGYATSKVDAERLCAARSAEGGAVVAARLFTVAGEGQRPDMALSRWIDDVYAGRPAIVFGSLARTRDITDVHDVCRSLVALAEAHVQGIVNVGTGVPHTLRDMLTAVEGALGKSAHVELRPVDHDDPAATLADPARLFETTGVRPCTDLPDLVRRQARAALDDGLLGGAPDTDIQKRALDAVALPLTALSPTGARNDL